MKSLVNEADMVVDEIGVVRVLNVVVLMEEHDHEGLVENGATLRLVATKDMG